eukprot:TRINITY_DN67_c0_g1_i6.p1 TRINITY_DN67_c0_g1~~TRINITY_DN67_c0_g1_i6.p1  ORF type:complete len:283 (-),score=23.12 TRINITY_DN67_c0_g1_i6:283-1131(-)
MVFVFLLLSVLCVSVSADTHCQAGYIDGKVSCYKDDWGNPILQYWAYTLKSNELTLETCMAACHEQNPDYKIFGIENGADQSNAECWCGNSPNYPTSGPTSGCDAPCPGNSAETCGGSGTLMSLYNILQCSSSPVPPPTGGGGEPIAPTHTPSPTPIHIPPPGEHDGDSTVIFIEGFMSALGAVCVIGASVGATVAGILYTRRRSGTQPTYAHAASHAASPAPAAGYGISAVHASSEVSPLLGVTQQPVDRQSAESNVAKMCTECGLVKEHVKFCGVTGLQH